MQCSAVQYLPRLAVGDIPMLILGVRTPCRGHCPLHCLLFTVQCTVYSVLYTVQCTVYSVLYTVQNSMHCPLAVSPIGACTAGGRIVTQQDCTAVHCTLAIQYNANIAGDNVRLGLMDSDAFRLLTSQQLVNRQH